MFFCNIPMSGEIHFISCRHFFYVQILGLLTGENRAFEKGLSILAQPIFRSLSRKCENTLSFSCVPSFHFLTAIRFTFAVGTSNLIQNTINLSEKTRRLEVHIYVERGMCRNLKNILPSYPFSLLLSFVPSLP